MTNLINYFFVFIEVTFDTHPLQSAVYSPESYNLKIAPFQAKKSIATKNNVSPKLRILYLLQFSLILMNFSNTIFGIVNERYFK